MNRTFLRRVNDPLCPLCKEEEETSLHFLVKCCATANIRRLHFGVPFLEPNDLKQAHWITLEVCKNHQEISITNWFIRGSALGPIGGLSARQSNSCLPRREERRKNLTFPRRTRTQPNHYYHRTRTEPNPINEGSFPSLNNISLQCGL